ncbi:MAG TPA: J domain-containing protein [Candidatus Dormibacteraeota bacterium]|nr:J domain-containing protein [Candidatus Dormibacteraeota bacterium]
MLLAELEVCHSRPIAPTRRLALGTLYLPTDPAPGFGALLLGGLVGAFAPQLDDESRDRLDVLLDDVERGRRIAQPRLRYRFQADAVGLDRSRHKLVGEGEHLSLQIDDHANGLPQILGAVYAAGRLSRASRASTFRLLRRATRWQGDPDHRLIGFLTGEHRELGAGGEGWALSVLGFSPGREPSRSEINHHFRDLVRDAHPDHGGSVEKAGRRILDLTEAKRILLTVE